MLDDVLKDVRYTIDVLTSHDRAVSTVFGEFLDTLENELTNQVTAVTALRGRLTEKRESALNQRVQGPAERVQGPAEPVPASFEPITAEPQAEKPQAKQGRPKKKENMSLLGSARLKKNCMEALRKLTAKYPKDTQFTSTEIIAHVKLLRPDVAKHSRLSGRVWNALSQLYFEKKVRRTDYALPGSTIRYSYWLEELAPTPAETGTRGSVLDPAKNRNGQYRRPKATAAKVNR